jgi:hypothetical protein
LACGAIDSLASGTPRIDAWIKGRGGLPLLGRFRRGCRSKLGASTDRGSRAIDPRVLPQLERDWYRIDGELTPPCRLVTLAVKLSVMDATQRYCELVTDTPPQRIRLNKPKVMRVGRRSAANQAWLPGDELSVLLIAQANRFAQGTDCALVSGFTGLRRNFPASGGISPTGGYHALDRDGTGWLASA